MNKIISYLKGHLLLPASFILMLISFAVTPPTGEMIVSLEWNGIALTAAMTLAAAGLKKEKVLEPLGKIADAFSYTGSLALFFTLAAFILSPFISSLASSLLIIPAAVSTLERKERSAMIPAFAALILIASTAGGMLLPSGSPQNILLSRTLGEASFLKEMLPFFLLSIPVTAITGVVLLRGKIRERIYLGTPDDDCSEGNKGTKMLYVCYIAVAVLTSFGLFSWFDVLVLLIVVALVFDRKVFMKADYSLLLSVIFLSIAGASLRSVTAPLISEGSMWKLTLSSMIIGSLPAAAAANGAADPSVLLDAVNIGTFGTVMQLPVIAALRILGKEYGKRTALIYAAASPFMFISLAALRILT